MHYDTLNPEFTEKFFKLIEENNSVVITAHKGPDGDSIASVLSTYTILTTLHPDKKIRIIYASEPINRFSFLYNFDKIEWVAEIADNIDENDLVIFLDGSVAGRFSAVPEKIQALQKTICIDHHHGAETFFTLSLVVPDFSSNAELIYVSIGQNVTMTPKLAQILLVGILSDTSNLSFVAPGQIETFASAQKLLLMAGESIAEIRSRYDTISPREYTLIQELVKNTEFKKLPNWPEFMYSYVDEDFVAKGSYTEIELTAAKSIFMSTYVRNISGYPWGFAVFAKGNGTCSGSFRSSELNVRQIVERMNIGGGHDRAAGAKFDQTKTPDVKSAIASVLEFLSNNKPLA